jgi:outer membrane lipoprotein-sorting protein
MKKGGVFALYMIFHTALLFGAENGIEDIFQYSLRDENKKRFLELCSRLQDHPVIKGSFEQKKTLSKLNRSLVSQGNFIIDAENGMVWDTLKPFPSTMAVGKDFMVQFRPGRQKTVLDARGNETFLRLAEVISAVFTGKPEILLKNFKVYFLELNGAWNIGLLPLDASVSIFASSIVMKGEKVLKNIYMREQSGDSIEYSLFDHYFPAALTDDEKLYFSLN